MNNRLKNGKFPLSDFSRLYTNIAMKISYLGVCEAAFSRVKLLGEL